MIAINIPQALLIQKALEHSKLTITDGIIHAKDNKVMNELILERKEIISTIADLEYKIRNYQAEL
jgi:hypothetical protein